MARIRVYRNGSKKEAITRKAASLFRKKGFNASSMRELALSIGVEAPSLYNHIGSKSELLQNICFKVADDFNMHMQQTEDSSNNTLWKIETLIRFHIQMMLQQFDEVYVANHEWKHLEEPYLGNFLNQRKAYERKMINLIRTGIQKNELNQIHPHVAVLTILSAVRGLEFWHRHRKEVGISDLENNIVDHLLNGLKK